MRYHQSLSVCLLGGGSVLDRTCYKLILYHIVNVQCMFKNLPSRSKCSVRSKETVKPLWNVHKMKKRHQNVFFWQFCLCQNWQDVKKCSQDAEVTVCCTDCTTVSKVGVLSTKCSPGRDLQNLKCWQYSVEELTSRSVELSINSMYGRQKNAWNQD